MFKQCFASKYLKVNKKVCDLKKLQVRKWEQQFKKKEKDKLDRE